MTTKELTTGYIPTTNKANYDNITVQSYYDRVVTDLSSIVHQQDEHNEVTRWNTYYYKKYQSQNNLMLFIIGACIVIIILTIIKNNVPYFDETAYSVIIGIILGIMIIHISKVIWFIYNKDNMNFDENDSGSIGGMHLTTPADISLNTVDISLNVCNNSNVNPQKIANSNFLKQLF